MKTVLCFKTRTCLPVGSFSLISELPYNYNITSSVSPGHKGIHWRSDFIIHGTCRETWSANFRCAINCLLLLEEKSLILMLYYIVHVHTLKEGLL